MKEKRGFTLIELLAVIVILAIIALIAVPIILNIIEKSKKSAFQDSVYGLIESAKLFYTESVLDGEVKDQVFEFGEEKTNDLKYSGSVPKGGSIVLTKNGEIEVAVHNNEWCAVKGKKESKIILIKYEEGKCEVTDKPDLPVEPNADTSGAEKPSLNGLVPIKWNGSNWIKADESNAAGANQWYDYNSGMWANAASIAEEYRNKTVGEEIPEDAINAYFVWIPRYEYDYINITNYAGGTQELPGEIKVNFIGKDKTSPTANYKIHPAFTLESTQLTGIWVGKFETTGNASAPTIKPNLSPLTNQNVSTQFATAQKFSARENSYGISTSADAHMMKNSEWGAVAYLSQSKYGKYGNNSYSGINKEVYINNYWNNSSALTGCSAGVPSTSNSTTCAYTYEKSTEGIGASTSGTIYGVYDMNGGAWEYVMGVYNGTIKNAGFSSLPASKYYDNYTTTNVATGCNNGICYGHALSETSGWYSDYVYFVNSNYPWFIRGGCYDLATNAGMFSFSGAGNAGGAYGGNVSFRVVVPG